MGENEQRTCAQVGILIQKEKEKFNARGRGGAEQGSRKSQGLLDLPQPYR
jgi:hypothetical protein